MQFSRIFLLIQYVFYVHGMVGENVRTANTGEFRFIVTIKVINEGNSRPEKDYICTGSMVSRRDVLTVAHNIQDYSMDTFEIVYGSIDIQRGQRAPVKWLKTYNNWANIITSQNKLLVTDLAIMRLYDYISVQPVALSSLSNDNLHGLYVVTAGWGDDKDGKTPRYMETVTLKVIKPDECKTRIMNLIGGKKTNIHKNFLCTAANPYAFLRKGDSGGPLLYNNELIAVNKGACPLPDGDFNPQKVNIHTGIYAHRSFVVDVINNY